MLRIAKERPHCSQWYVSRLRMSPTRDRSSSVLDWEIPYSQQSKDNNLTEVICELDEVWISGKLSECFRNGLYGNLLDVDGDDSSRTHKPSYLHVKGRKCNRKYDSKNSAIELP